MVNGTVPLCNAPAENSDLQGSPVDLYSASKLYNLRCATGRVQSTPTSVGSATIRALDIEVIRNAIAESFLPSRSAQQPPTMLPSRSQFALNALLRTCTAFFEPGVKVLWSSIDYVEAILSVLLQGDFRLNPGVQRISEIHNYIVEKYGRGDLNNLDNVHINHLTFYLIRVKRLRASTTTIPAEIAALLQRLLPTGYPMFPRLIALDWSDWHSPVLRFNAPLYRLIRGPATSVTMCIPTTVSAFREWADAAMALICTTPIPIEDLHIIASHPFAHGALLMESLQQNLVDLFQPCPNAPTEASRAQCDVVKKHLSLLEQCWDHQYPAKSSAALSLLKPEHLVRGIPWQHTTELELIANEKYILQHMSVCLDNPRLDIMIIINPAWVDLRYSRNIRLADMLRPAIPAQSLRAIRIQLVGPSFRFTESDLDAVATIWPNVLEMWLKYNPTADVAPPDLPALRRILTTQWRNMDVLEVPRLDLRVSRLALPHGHDPLPPFKFDAAAVGRPCGPRLVYLSSATTPIYDHPIDMDALAEALLHFLPSLQGLGRMFDSHDEWQLAQQAISRATARRRS
ncbi:hypothetical protein C8Q77DRAFT_1076014 [Trametes polyzona]|nr:hypothetical protein C8Q77DRAFT_1076014 [Trametes polyzona]